MAQIRNLHWWTVEYGLIGQIGNPKIYGAGLLSSIGESKLPWEPVWSPDGKFIACWSYKTFENPLVNSNASHPYLYLIIVRR